MAEVLKALIKSIVALDNNISYHVAKLTLRLSVAMEFSTFFPFLFENVTGNLVNG